MYKIFKELLFKYHKGTATSEERLFIEYFFEKMQEEGCSKEEIISDIALRNRILKKIQNNQKVKFRHTIYRRAVILAASLFPIALAVFYFTKSISLENSQIVYQTKKGERLEFYLSDSTRVYLNSSSKLSYTNNFSKKERNVELEGEAFFEVRKDAQKPFSVQSPHLKTTVLGTSFNVNDFTEGTTSVSVHSGKVQVEGGRGQVFLNKDERVFFDKSSQSLLKENFDHEASNQWIKGRVQFEKLSIYEVVKILNRRFNVDIQIQNSSLIQDTYYISGDFNGEDVEDVLNGIQFIYGVEYIKKTDDQFVMYIN